VYAEGIGMLRMRNLVGGFNAFDATSYAPRGLSIAIVDSAKK
jgi:hypothetical protein